MSENAFAEQPALEWLQELGWAYVHGSSLAPDVAPASRHAWSEVVLRDRLAAGVTQLNPSLTPEAVADVVAQVVATDSPNVVEDHAAFHDLLVDGVRVSFTDAAGEQRHERARLADFDDPPGNDLVVVNQLTIVTGSKNRRPDVLLYVNGLPLAELELKSPGSVAATTQGAVNQVRAYAEVMPQLYRFVELIAVSDLAHALVGTLTSEAEHFSTWRSMDPADDAGRSKLEVLIRGVLAPACLLELIRGFVTFRTDGPRLVKLLARYHQVDAVRRALDATREAMASDGRAGVVWHTQGSGKSLTMVFYVQALRRDPAFANPTIVAVTDRRDLDDQLHRTFAQQRSLEPAVRRAGEIAGGVDSLRELLNVPAGGIVFTTIQKFRPVAGETSMPVLSDRRNVVVMADEAHRTQYADLARNLQIALPNATRIGFTGTPIERTDRSTQSVFGDYVSVYAIQRAVEDGATVPIYYESRVVHLHVADDALLEAVDDALGDDDEETASRAASRWAQLEKVVGADARQAQIVDDLVEHFARRCQEQDGKAMVVCMSRRIAAAVTGRLKFALGNESVTCVMSQAPSDDPELHGPGGEYRRSAKELEHLADDFKDPDHPLRMVVVRDMWLTGFDAPCLHTLYVDKPMRDHGLLQAIARVNRVFRDKPGGLIVDYIGIGDDLRSSLAAYDPEDVDRAMISVDEALVRFKEKHGVVRDILHGIDYSGFAAPGATKGQQATVLALTADAVLANDDVTARFLREQSLMQRWYVLCQTDPRTAAYGSDVLLFRAVAGMIRKLQPTGGPSREAEQALKQFYAEGLAAGEVLDVLELADGGRPDISILSDDFLDTLGQRVKPDNLRRKLLERLLSDEIRSTGRRNATQARLFGDRLRDVLARYTNRVLTSAQVIQELIELAKEIRDERERHRALGLSEEELAFYDALAGGVESGAVDPRVAEITHELVGRIRQDLTVDWTRREASQAALRRTIKRLLRSRGFTTVMQTVPGGGSRQLDLDDITELIIGQARIMYAVWPDAAVG